MRILERFRADIERRQLRDLDPVLFLVTLALVICGLVVIYSATRSLPGVPHPHYYVQRQAQWAVLGLLAGIAVLGYDYRALQKWTYVLYIGTVAVLAAVMVLGFSAAGAERWLALGPVRLQPSEFAKVSIILTLAAYLDRKQDLSRFSSLIGPLLHVAPPMVLIALQPDIGTALVFAAITLGMLYFAGAQPKHLFLLILAGVGAIVLAGYLTLQGYVPLLKDYQVRRLAVFLDPYADPTGDGWNVIQSMIAIGSGGFFGKGLFGGSQTQLNFVPARHTDFIFSVIGEEFGFLGATFILFLFALLIWRLLRVTVLAKDRYGMLIAGGITSMFFFHILVNVGMTLGVMPITGITLPFLSQGGSSLMANLICIGIASNIVMRRRKIHF